MTTPTAQERVHLSLPAAQSLALAALRGLGYDETEAALVAAHVIDAALCGYEYSGLPKILNVAQMLPVKPADGPMRLRRETPVSAQYDGANHNGMITIDRATDVAIAKARTSGFAVVGVNRTWMSGRSAYFAERIARAGLVGIHTVGSVALVAPPGAAARAVGTNPIAFGFPTEGEPLVIDMGFSTLMVTDLRLRARRGELLPADSAIDAEGRPTRDPVAALAGAVLFFGGYKGFGLALAMQALAVMAGADEDPDGAGYLIVAMQPDLLLSLDDYRKGLTKMLARIKATPRQPGVEEIRIPSERSAQSRVRLARDGIEIDRAVHDALLAMAAGSY